MCIVGAGNVEMIGRMVLLKFVWRDKTKFASIICKIATMLICCSVVVATVWFVVHFYLQVSQSVSDLSSDSSKHSNRCSAIPGNFIAKRGNLSNELLILS